MFHRVEQKNQAKEAMRGNWPHILFTVALIMIVVGCLNVISSSSDTFNWGDLLIWLLEGPLAISFCGFILQLRRNKTVHTQQFFDGFSNFIKWMLAGLWQNLWLLLWTLLLIIPGVVKYYSYSQYYFILADNPDADLRQALKTSMKMTDGCKGDLFIASLSFLNWYLVIGAIQMTVMAFLWPQPDLLLGSLLCVPVYFYLVPYMAGTFAGIYEELKANALANGVCSPEEFGLSEVPPVVQFTAANTEPQDDSSIYYDDDEPVDDELTYMEQKEAEQSSTEQKQEE